MFNLTEVGSSHSSINFPVQTLSGSPEPDGISREQTRLIDVSNSRANILAIGDDPVLLYSRRLVLERDGYLVVTMRSDATMKDEQLRGFDLVLLCHSIPEKVAGHIVEALWRVTPQTPVLLISRLDVCASAGPHHISVSAYPAAMLGAVAQQLSIHKTSGTHPHS